MAQEQQYRELTGELRCPKCQNTSIADSNAVIAGDMRDKVYHLMLPGQSKQQIIDYMVARYGRARHIEDVQRALLTDISAAPARSPLPRWVLIPEGVLLAVALGLYGLTGGVSQVLRWRQTVNEFPALRVRVSTTQGQPLSAEALSRFAVGLRAELQQHPAGKQNWLILGRLGVVLNNADMATQAFAKAWRLAPEDDAIALDYASVLTRSADPGDNGAGNRLLREITA